MTESPHHRVVIESGKSKQHRGGSLVSYATVNESGATREQQTIKKTACPAQNDALTLFEIYVFGDFNFCH